MNNIVTCARIGTGTDNDPFRPDTDALAWRKLEERETEFVIEIVEDNL